MEENISKMYMPIYDISKICFLLSYVMGTLTITLHVHSVFDTMINR
jgi:hypothetical protein